MRIALIILLATTLVGCSKNKKAKPLAVSLQASEIVPRFSVDPNIIQKASGLSMFGTGVDQVAKDLSEFPLSKYKMVGVYTGQEVEYFCVDSEVDYIKKDLLKGVPWEPYVTGYFFKYCKPGSVAVDIGAHIGTHTVQLSRAVGKEGRVVAFEPQPKIFKELLLNMTLNQVENCDFYWAACGKEHSQIELSPLYAPNEGGTPFGTGSTGQYVDLTPLDELNLKNVSFIKIDVESMEIDVLEGARQTILRDRPVLLVEILGGCAIERANQEQREIIRSRRKHIESLGYELMRVNQTCDYLAFPKNSEEFREISKTREYRRHLKFLKKSG